MTLLVGLGNIGREYEDTRHNIGFMLLDEVAREFPTKDVSKKEFKGELLKSGELLFLKPHTFMNLSGESITPVINFYKVENLIIIHDDLDLPFGALRFKRGGGTGGHNGLKSLDNWSAKESIRIRMGIGKPVDRDISKFVLGEFNGSEKECLQKWIDLGKSATLQILESLNWEKVASLKSVKSSAKFCQSE
jgi:PTH1 family peptidyl-tRNA hydrolase